MKKLLLAGAIALFGLSNAQMTKGDWVISGNTGLGFNATSSKVKANGQSQDGPKISSFSVTPSVGYFVIDGLAVGIDLGFDSRTTKQDGDKLTVSTFSVMPTATYYFQTGSKFFPFVGVGAGYASSKTKYSISSSIMDPLLFEGDSTTDGLAWKAKAGVTYMATQSLGINLGVGFDQFYTKDSFMGTEIKTTTTNFGVNVGFSYFIKGKAQKSDK
ncbi:outer membrane protein [Chryseobacterium ginsenosidimutans]|uniref:OmpW family outer membrane protein n=1 Tax=Chryseobacterium ginsenosidimutans TaxID=687846 RepID=UPI002784CB49|nr:OmpW family outer membrane protein [Chryseobacterium ginsenosidimutans]MDQ0594057.1 outer membrane protein [Chryseobacterium ginsenosidimutans]